MSWINVLSETYDNCIGAVGKVNEEENIVLLPVSHLTAQAQVEITIDMSGNFQHAHKVEKAEAMTIIPVTEDSAARSSGIAPMPLCDKLCYIAGDYDEQIHPRKSMKDHYESYMMQLEKWVQSAGVPKRVQAVYRYLSHGSVISDLKSVGLFESPDDFVRFIVIGDSMDADANQVWLNKDIYESFINFYDQMPAEKNLCYATGKVTTVTGKLPAKIRNTGDKAKLISSNDTSGYTYRGRFKTADEAVGIGYMTAQKAHNALRWLIAKQGYRNGSESIVCWSPGGDLLPDPTDGCDSLFPSDEDKAVYTAEEYAVKVNKAIAGYQQKIKPSAKAVVMAVDTADGSGQGRLAITYYAEMKGSELLENIEKWQSECIWIHNYRKGKDDKYFCFTGAPSPREIALSAYGTDQGGMLKADDKVIKKCVDRILPCVVQKRKMPKDIVLAAVKNVGDPLRYSSYNWNRIYTNTCAMIRKMQCDNRKEVYGMALNENSTDRDYLFGRLLAVTDRIESQVNFRENIKRDTNAKKYWSTFTRKPAKTWAVIYDRLLPYLSKLKGYEKNWFSKIIEDILDKLEAGENFNNEPLKENYLLGYYSQTAAFRKSSDDAQTLNTKEDT